MGRRRDLPSARAIAALCEPLAAAAVDQACATPAAVAAVHPGGASNPGRQTDWRAWLRCYGLLNRMLGSAGADAAPRRADEADAARRAADVLVLDALRARATEVRLSGTDTVTVHPKSPEALIECQWRDQLLAQLARVVHEAQHACATSDDPTAHELLRDALQELHYQHSVCAWIACTPGPELPYPPEAERPAVPADVRARSALELGVISGAFAEVNYLRLRALEALALPDSADAGVTRPTWSSFFAGLALEHEPGAARRLLRNVSLAETLVTRRVGGAALEAAREAARVAAGAGGAGGG